MSDEELSRVECPNCGKGFDVAVEPFGGWGMICPYCGAEIEN